MNFFCFWSQFHQQLDPDPDPRDKSNADPDPKHCCDSLPAWLLEETDCTILLLGFVRKRSVTVFSWYRSSCLVHRHLSPMCTSSGHPTKRSTRIWPGSSCFTQCMLLALSYYAIPYRIFCVVPKIGSPFYPSKVDISFFYLPNYCPFC